MATVIIAAITFPSHLVERPRSDSAAKVVSESQDNDLLADLDDLVGPEDGPAWDDAVLL
jgi:hypothetical protein